MFSFTKKKNLASPPVIMLLLGTQTAAAALRTGTWPSFTSPPLTTHDFLVFDSKCMACSDQQPIGMGTGDSPVEKGNQSGSRAC